MTVLLVLAVWTVLAFAVALVVGPALSARRDEFLDAVAYHEQRLGRPLTTRERWDLAA